MIKQLPNIGDFVIHQPTQDWGKVIGYGHQLIEEVYHSTLKVQILSLSMKECFLTREDIVSQWADLSQFDEKTD